MIQSLILIKKLHKNFKLSSVSGLPVADANLVFNAEEINSQPTCSGTTNGKRFISENALSQVTVAQD